MSDALNTTSTTDLLKRVRRIEIKTKALSNNIFAGEYHSAFKGHGMSFAEVREYQPGDDVRNIDWNVTARFGKPFVKVFEEERELNVMLLIDVSPSLAFGTGKLYVRELVAEIAATLAFSAIQNNDKIGAIFFTDRIEKFIPPKKGKRHTLRIIRDLLDFQPEGKRTDVGVALEYLSRVIKRKSIAFMMSDFLDVPDFSRLLQVAARKHDVIALQTYDRRSAELPDVGLVKMVDAETGHEQYVDTSSRAVRAAYRNWWNDNSYQLSQLFTKNGVDFAQTGTDNDYVKVLRNLFARRV